MDLSEARVLYMACPLCDAKGLVEEQIGDCRNHPRYHPEIPSRMRWVRCQACAHVFTEGYLSQRAQDIVFQSPIPYQRPGADWHGTRTISARIVEKARAALGGVRGRWLDVGFGNGALLGAADEYGFAVVGLDLRVENVELMRLYGVEAHALDLTAYEPEAPLSVISMADVLEHMPFPKPALVHTRRILADDGVLFLSMPNSDCMVWKRLDDLGENPYWGELEHYHNFGRKRLYALLEEHGFSPVSYGISERYYMCMEVLAKKR